MPLPRELRNRVKAFIDIFVDRMSRGLGGLLLLFMVAVLHIGGHSGSRGAIQRISFVVMLLTIPWILLSLRASKEYVATIRKRIASRQLDLESTRIRATDAETIRVLEEAANGANPRQAAYALSLLAQAPDYDVGPLLRLFADSPIPEARRTAYELARLKGDRELIGKATTDISGSSPDLSRASAAYLMAVSPEPLRLAHDLLESGNYPAAQAVLESLTPRSAEAGTLVPNEWIDRAARDSDPQRRALATLAIGVAGGDGSAETLRRLLQDPDERVIVAACRAASRLGGRTYLLEMVGHLSNTQVRGAVIESIAALARLYRVSGSKSTYLA